MNVYVVRLAYRLPQLEDGSLRKAALKGN